VVVPTYRRPELLERCLAALVAQDFDPAAYEIVVADDAGCADTERQVARWSSRSCVAVRYLPVPAARAPGPAAARNRGWRAARGDLIAFTDDDCIPDRDWLRAGVAAFDCCACRDDEDGERGGAIIGVWGRIVVPLPAVPTDHERNAAGLEGAEAATANCFYRRAALAAVGGFDERYTLAWREDSDLFLTLLERGARLVHAPEAIVVHPVRRARWGISLSQQRKSEFNALLYKKHPALYRARIQPSPPWHYYRIVVALLAAIAGIVGRRRRVLLLALGAWLAMTARFCALRLRGTSRAPRHVAEMVVTSALIPPLAVYWRLRGAVRWRVPFL
jgi:glycosyltransferase involved in cell wall biosynthesis